MIASCISFLLLLALAVASPAGYAPTLSAANVSSLALDFWEPTERILQSNGTNYTIPVYFWHAYHPKDRLKKLTEKDIRSKYWSHLKRSFKETPFRFVLKGIRIVESSIYGRCAMNTYTEVAIKNNLRVNNKKVLNVYICNTVKSNRTAWSSSPAMSDTTYDGVVLGNYKLYASKSARVGRWNAIGHEVGHFLGLLHTFEGGCSTEPWRGVDGTMTVGDGVRDTPSHALPTDDYAGAEICWALDPPLDTCPDNIIGLDAGVDPVTNVMNYLSAECSLNATFSQGQIDRMIAQHEMFRLDHACRAQWVACTLDSTCCEGLSCKPDNVTKFSCQ